MSAAVVDARRLWALCRKESLQIVRDPSSILIAFVLPMLLLFIFGYGINLDANKVRIGVVVEDSGAEARRFLQALSGSPLIEVEPCRTRQQARAQLDAGTVRGAVLLGPDFSAKVRQGQGAAAVTTASRRQRAMCGTPR